MATDQKPQAQVRFQKEENQRNKISDRGAGGKYSIAHLTYPSDLFTAGPAAYGNCWTLININVLEQSKYFAETTTADLNDAEKLQRQERNQTEARVRDNSALVEGLNIASSGAIAGGAVRVSGLKIKNFLSAGGKTAILKSGAQIFGQVAIEGAKGAAKGAAVAGGLTAAPLLLAQTATRETKRISAAIVLPMPNALVTQYNMRWGEDATRLFDLMARGVTVAKNPLDAAAAASLSATALVQAQGLSAATGLASNPKKEMFFESVGFRNFQLEYKFYPKDPDEAQYIKNIIFHLKFHMHPEYKTDGRYTFVYPSEFDISFYKVDAENTWVNKIATCVLTDLSVNYTPDGLWAAHDGGQPNAIVVNMSFRELTVLTKEMIDRGY